MNIVLFGAPGAGKGTQSARLVNELGMVQISTGDILRDAISKGSDLGARAKVFMDQGKLVPDDLIVELVERVIKNEERHFVLDGFPRNELQARILDKMLAKQGKLLGKAVFLEVPFDVIVERLSGRRTCKDCGAIFHIKSKLPKMSGVCDLCGGSLIQRPDDIREVIETRLKTYSEFTEPLMGFYRSEGKLFTVDGNRDPKDVFESIVGIFS